MSVIEEKKALRTFIRKKERTLDPPSSAVSICRIFRTTRCACSAKATRCASST